MSRSPRSGCPINAAVEVLGDPWAVLVLRDIMFGNLRYFRELSAGSEEGIATNILASRLKQLVDAGLLSREAGRRGQRVKYSLTDAGIQVLPVMVALGNWGLAHRKIRSGDYWVQDNRSDFYNRARNRSQGGFRWRLPASDPNSSERLGDYPKQYEFSIVTFSEW